MSSSSKPRIIASTPAKTRSLRSPPQSARGAATTSITVSKSPPPVSIPSLSLSSLSVDHPPAISNYHPFPYQFSAPSASSKISSSTLAIASLVTLQIGALAVQYDVSNPFLRLSQIHDLLALVFDCLQLADIGLLLQVCRALSFAHYHYHWKRHHIVRWTSFTRCFRHTSLLLSSLLCFSGDANKFSTELIALLRSKQPRRRRLFVKKNEAPLLVDGTWHNKIFTAQLSVLEEFCDRAQLKASTLTPPGAPQWAPLWLGRLVSDVEAMQQFRFNAVDEMDNSDLPRKEWAKLLAHVEWMKLAPIRWAPTVMSPASPTSSVTSLSSGTSSPTQSPSPSLRSLISFSPASSSLLSLDVGDEFNQPLPIGLLPFTLTFLRIGRGYLQELLPGVLPPSLRHLQLHSTRFKEPLVPGSLNDGLLEFDDLRARYTAAEISDPGILPSSLKRFSAYLIRLNSVGVLPEGLEHLRLRGYHGSIAANVLPASLKKLVFSEYSGFNDDLDVCLANCTALESLHLDEDFCQVLMPRTLPASLTELKFAPFSRYSHKLVHGMLPPNLKSLTLGRGFIRQNIEPHVLPSSLTELLLPANTDGRVFLYEGSMPIGMRVVVNLADSPAEIRLWKKPHTLQKLSFHPKFDFSCHLTDLPCASLIELDLGEEFNHELEVDHNKAPPLLPKLKKLTLSNSFNQQLSPGACFPNLEALLVGTLYNQPLTKERMPPALQTLKFDAMSRFNQPLSVSLFPDTLTVLHFGRIFNSELTRGMLPRRLKTLSFQGRFNQLLHAGVLPDSLEELIFAAYDQALQPGGLPPSLKTLILQGQFNHPLRHLPASLTHLQLDSSFCTKILPGELPEGMLLLELFSQHHERLLGRGSRPKYMRVKMTMRDGYRLKHEVERSDDEEEEQVDKDEEEEKSDRVRSTSSDSESKEVPLKKFTNGKSHSKLTNKGDCVCM